MPLLEHGRKRDAPNDTVCAHPALALPPPGKALENRTARRMPSAPSPTKGPSGGSPVPNADGSRAKADGRGRSHATPSHGRETLCEGRARAVPLLEGVVVRGREVGREIGPWRREAGEGGFPRTGVVRPELGFVHLCWLCNLLVDGGGRPVVRRLGRLHCWGWVRLHTST